MLKHNRKCVAFRASNYSDECICGADHTLECRLQPYIIGKARLCICGKDKR